MQNEFWREKKVLITGHTGFKGTWLSKILLNKGAKVTGYSLLPPTEPSLFNLCNLGIKINSIIGDIRDLSFLKTIFNNTNPEIVFHLAAQPIVQRSYKEPVYTYETNVMGTVNILECIRHSTSVRSFINVTTDKVYKNNEWCWGYRENDQLDGFDPYSNSKSCSELITHSYKNSFFSNRSVAISTIRAGNVIGGGDFAQDRVIPDCIRAAEANQIITIRNPNSIRPYQHVLEPLFAYLLLAQAQFEDSAYSNYYNVAPSDIDCVTTERLVDLFCNKWGENLHWKTELSNRFHEANVLKLDCSLFKSTFNWQPLWNIEKAIEKTVALSKHILRKEDIEEHMEEQINEYFDEQILRMIK